MVSNKALIFTEIPNGWPEAGKHLAVRDIGFDLDAAPPKNGFTVEVTTISLDPYLRGRMRDPKIKSYNAPFKLDEPMANFGIGKVLKSDDERFKEGDIVRGVFPIAQYAAIDEAIGKQAEKLNNPHNLDEKYFVGALGMPGITAYSSLYEIGKPKKGETIFISAASGAVGQLVGQLAKHEGLTVIGSVGSKEKLDYITKTLGFDGGFNYKEEKATDALARLAPNGIDIYYDNVGGEQLDAALTAANAFSRFIMCGMISQYSSKPEEKYGVKNLTVVVPKRITMRGFIVMDPDFWLKYGREHNERVGAWIADGTFKVSQSVTKGIENAAEGFMGMLKGENFGKAILTV